MSIASWLYTNFSDEGEWGVWRTDSTLPGYDYSLKSGWPSSMAQGMGISVMLAAYSMTDDGAYLQVARKAISAFGVSAVVGGIAGRFGNTVWYDEYPTYPDKHVLNGFIFSLAGLYDYYCVTKESDARRYLDDGFAALEAHVSSFDAGWASYYSASVNRGTDHGIATITGARYQALHAAQLLWAHSVTKKEIFYQYANWFLQQDFGESVISYALKPKFSEVVASHSIDPKNHGPDKTVDSIISYGEYWSSSRFPASISYVTNRDVDALSAVVVVTTGEKIEVPDIFVTVGADRRKMTVGLVDEFFLQERHHQSLVHVYRLASPVDGVSAIDVVFDRAESGIIKVREFNAMYDMSPELEYLKDQLGY